MIQDRQMNALLAGQTNTTDYTDSNIFILISKVTDS